MDSPNCQGISFFYFIVICTFLCSSIATRDLANTSEFIKTSCGTTLYPKLCIETLSPYSNTIQTSPMELANSALTVSLKGAKSTTSKISKMSKEENLGPAEAHALMDCVENMEDSVDELQKSLLEMKNLNGPDFEEKMGNVMTWGFGGKQGVARIHKFQILDSSSPSERQANRRKTHRNPTSISSE